MERPTDARRMKGCFLALLGLLTLASCGEKESPEPQETPQEPQTTGFSCDLAPSSLMVLDGGWKPGSQILLVVAGQSSAYQLPASTTSALTTVKGEAAASTSVFVAAPYGKEVEFLGTSIGTTIPNHQSGKDAASISYSAAKLTGSRVQMKDLCSRLTFTLKETSFSSLKVSAQSDVKLAGKVRISLFLGRGMLTSTNSLNT